MDNSVEAVGLRGWKEQTRTTMKTSGIHCIKSRYTFRTYHISNYLSALAYSRDLDVNHAHIGHVQR